MPVDRATYRSLASHEAAHAIAACNLSVQTPTIQAQEYLAYVALFSTMPAGLRQRVLRNTSTAGFDSLERFTPLLYMFDPMRFGAKASLYFSKAADQTSMTYAVLSGQSLRD